VLVTNYVADVVGEDGGTEALGQRNACIGVRGRWGVFGRLRCEG
jgi:hypothetical protein